MLWTSVHELPPSVVRKILPAPVAAVIATPVSGDVNSISVGLPVPGISVALANVSPPSSVR